MRLNWSGTITQSYAENVVQILGILWNSCISNAMKYDKFAWYFRTLDCIEAGNCWIMIGQLDVE